MRKFNVLYALAIVTIVTFTLSSCAENQYAFNQSTHIKNQSNITAQRSFSGGYLAGRFAQHQQDWDAAQFYMSTVLKHDKNNELLSQRTFLLTLGSGNIDKALDIAKELSKTTTNELATILLACNQINKENFNKALEYINQLPNEGFGQYTKPLLTAWAYVGLGKKEDALQVLKENSSDNDPTYNMHAGLIEEFTGNIGSAAKHYRAAMAGGLDLHTAIIVANFFDKYKQEKIAENIYANLDKIYPFNPFSRSRNKNSLTNITKASDGAALAMFDLATLLYSKRAFDSAKIYNNVVQLLNRDYPLSKLMMGDIAALHNQYDKAVNIYSSVKRNSPVYWLSRNRVSEVYEINGDLEKSISILEEMSKETEIRTQVLASLGDTYRRHERFADAVNAYDAALSSVKKITNEHWKIIYARGMAKEKLNNWALAEKDLLQALEFQPENPMILNFIAYSWASQGKNLKKAEKYAALAAKLDPNNGYVLDSYGWTLFLLGKYKDSIRTLEKAVEQMPGDSTILDHLGDAYWQANRKNEARHQWNKAKDLSEDVSFKDLISKKIKNGIVVPAQIERTQAKLY